MELIKFLTVTIVMLILFSFDTGSSQSRKEQRVRQKQDKECLMERAELLALSKSHQRQNDSISSVNTSCKKEQARMKVAGMKLVKALKYKYVLSSAELDDAEQIFTVRPLLSGAQSEVVSSSH